MLNRPRKSITILMAEDDPDDRMLTKDAFEENRLMNDLRFVEDGEELMDYLYRRGKFVDPHESPRPGVILLDLNMPRKDGREALKEIKDDAEFVQDLGMDSMMALEVLASLEKKYKIIIPEEELLKFTTLNNTVGVVSKIING